MEQQKENLKIKIGKTLRELRILSGFTMMHIAFEAEMEYNQLSRIERGKVSTSIYSLGKICIALNIPLSTFFLMIEKGSITKTMTLITPSQISIETVTKIE